MQMVSKAFLPLKWPAIVSIVAPRGGGGLCGAYNGQWKVLVRLAFEPLLPGQAQGCVQPVLAVSRRCWQPGAAFQRSRGQADLSEHNHSALLTISCAALAFILFMHIHLCVVAPADVSQVLLAPAPALHSDDLVCLAGPVLQEHSPPRLWIRRPRRSACFAFVLSFR